MLKGRRRLALPPHTAGAGEKRGLQAEEEEERPSSSSKGLPSRRQHVNSAPLRVSLHYLHSEALRQVMSAANTRPTLQDVDHRRPSRRRTLTVSGKHEQLYLQDRSCSGPFLKSLSFFLGFTVFDCLIVSDAALCCLILKHFIIYISVYNTFLF